MSQSFISFQDEELVQEQRFVSKIQDNKTGISRVKSVCCIRISQDWQMKSQVMIASIILFMSIFILLTIVTGYNIVQVGVIMKNSQNQLYVSQAQKHLSVVSTRFKRLVTTHFKAGNERFIFVVSADSEKFQKIYLVVSSQRDELSKNLLDTPNSLNVTHFKAQFTNQWVCYNAYSNGTDTVLIDANNRGFINSVKHYDQIYPLLLNQNYTYLATSKYGAFWTPQQLLYLYPCNHLGLAYRPQNRSWYIEMTNLYSSNRDHYKINIGSHLTQPFFNYRTNVTTVSLLKLIYNKKYDFQGTQGSTIQISGFNALFKLSFNEFTALLVNYDGNLLISPFFDGALDGISLSLHFSNQTITGYDQEDWSQVVNLALGKQITHNCSLMYLDTVTNLLCRWNEIKQKNELIFATHLKVLNYFIIILLDEENLLQQLHVQQEQIQNILIQTSIIFFAQLIAVFIFLLALVLTIIQMIFKPLINLTTFCKQINERNLAKVNEKKTPRIELKNVVSDGVFHPITTSFRNIVKKLTGLRTRRNYICQEIESIQYPLQGEQRLPLKNQILQLNNNHEQIDERKIGSRIQSLNMFQLQQISLTPQEVNAQYQKRLIHRKYQNQIELLQASMTKSGRFSQQKLIQLIFSYYKKI